MDVYFAKKVLSMPVKVKEKVAKDKSSKPSSKKAAEPDTEDPLPQRDTPRRSSVMPVTQAAISTFFGEGSGSGRDERGAKGEKQEEEKSLKARVQNVSNGNARIPRKRIQENDNR